MRTWYALFDNRRNETMANKSSKARVNSKRVNAASPAFLVQVYESAKASGEATTAMIATLRSGKIMWGQKALLGPIAEAFRQGRMAGSLGVTRDEAKRILALKGWKKDATDNDKRRTFSQQQAYRAAISAWSYCAREAGMPHQATGAKRKPRPAQVPVIVDGKGSTAPVVLERVIVPQAANIDDVKSFARNMAALMSRFENKNAKVIGEYHALFADFRKAVKELAAKESAVNLLKTAA
jgi:hypothetical protein